MTRDELTAVLTKPFRCDFAANEARRVVAEDAVALLYEIAVDPPAALPRMLRERAAFRAAYVLEYLFFHDSDRFAPYRERFCQRDFVACTSGGARRHFAKMMAHLLPEMHLDAASVGRIAEAAAQWTIDPKTKVAVRIWCVEILKQCRSRCAWVDEMWEDLLLTLDYENSPAIAARMRNGWRASLL